MEARYKGKDEPAFVLLASGGKGGKHLHVEVATKRHFAGTPPKPTHKVADIRSAIEEVKGKSVDVRIRGYYLIREVDLPTLIRSAIVETTEGDVSIKATSGTLSIEGAPIDELRWFISQKGDEASVRLDAHATLQIDDSYLNQCLNIIDPAYDVFVLGR